MQLQPGFIFLQSAFSKQSFSMSLDFFTLSRAASTAFSSLWRSLSACPGTSGASVRGEGG